ncbi:hypothetical protein BDW74DRAFT_148345 [Aspergillus multicolor]|uniref:uncharacterized protein n=1 Tax=Aspergillus multicolor TaxID=41759 RepID=UPI003CCDE0F4
MPVINPLAMHPPDNTSTSVGKRIEPPPRHPGRAAAAKPIPRDNGGDGYSTESEEEIISELDEAALAQLPLHLQNNMRELQAERVSRPKAEQHLSSKQLQHKLRYRLHRVDEKVKSKKETKCEPELNLKGEEYNAYYAEKWFKKTLAKIAATRELEVKRVMEGSSDSDDSSSRRRTWCAVRHEWVPVAHGQRPESIENRIIEGNGAANISGAGGNWASRLCGIPDRKESSLYQKGTVVTEQYLLTTRHDCGMSSHEGYMSWRCAGPYYVYESRTSQECSHQPEPPEQSSESLSSIVSTARDRVRMKIRRVKNVFKR